MGAPPCGLRVEPGGGGNAPPRSPSGGASAAIRSSLVVVPLFQRMVLHAAQGLHSHPLVDASECSDDAGEGTLAAAGVQPEAPAAAWDGAPPAGALLYPAQSLRVFVY